MTSGFVVVFIAVTVFLGLVGCCVLTIAHTILARIQSRPSRLLFLLIAMAVGMVFLVQLDTLMMMDAALAFSVPFAVLVLSSCFPQYIGGQPRMWRIFQCYIVIYIVGIIVSLLFYGSGLAMIPWIYWHTALSNGLIYVCLILGYTGLAIVVFRIIDKWKGTEA
ncbi:MAG: hypothetical protein WC382_13340 [Methanoregulaceae archaeon]|jgi:hypothetical protein